jgi:hypothetical protein
MREMQSIHGVVRAESWTNFAGRGLLCKRRAFAVSTNTKHELTTIEIRNLGDEQSAKRKNRSPLPGLGLEGRVTGLKADWAPDTFSFRPLAYEFGFTSRNSDVVFTVGLPRIRVTW